MPTRDDLTLAWGDIVLTSLSPRAKSRFAAGRFLSVEVGKARFGLPNRMHRDRCESVKAEVEAALSAHFGRPLELELVVETAAQVTSSGAAGQNGDDAEEDVPAGDLIDEAPPPVASIEDRLMQAFPGAEEVT